MSIVKLNNRAVRSATAVGTTTQLGNMVLIKKLTASSSATLSFVDGASDVVLDNTYKEYVFVFNDIHPATDSVSFQFNLSIDGGSNYNVTKTTTEFSAYHNEGDSATALGYNTVNDLAQSTNDQKLSSSNLGNGDDEAFVGTLHLFNPSSTTFVKHFISRVAFYHDSDYAIDGFIAGYGNTTSAVNAVIFKMSSGNIDAGTITLYGIT